MAHKLTPKQAMFVIEYLKDLNATQAAIRAGYSEDSAYSIGEENLKKPEISTAIQEQMDCRAQRTLVTADFVVAGLREVASRCLQKKPVMVFNKFEKKMEQLTESYLDDNGEEVSEGVWEFDSAGANKAFETMAKHLKLITDKVEHTGADGKDLLPPNIIFEAKKSA
jgi:phage terminase small subunit